MSYQEFSAYSDVSVRYIGGFYYVTVRDEVGHPHAGQSTKFDTPLGSYKYLMFLNESVVKVPALAMVHLRKEVGIYEFVDEMVIDEGGNGYGY